MDRRPAVHDPSARRHHHVDVAAHQRLRSLDVVRGVALLGVIALNYHATLNGVEAFAPLDRTFLSRLFNPVSGVLSTRFAATYVFVAGMGVALMTSRVRTDDQDGIRHLRVKLLRRGAALLLVGYGLEWVWPGTILFYYGAYFMIASVFVVTSNRTLVVASVSSVLAAATLNVWRVSERFDDNFTAWLEPPSPDSPRNVVIRLFVAYTHPVLPWIAYFFAGMIVARGVRSDRVINTRLALGSVVAVVAAYILRDAIRPALLTGQSETLRASVVSLQPFDRGVLYVVSSLGIAIVSVWVVENIVRRFPNAAITELLVRGGRMSLSLYVLHIIVFKLVVDVFSVVDSKGLETALLLTAATYTAGLGLAWIVLGHRSHGPIEWLYRLAGGR